MELPTGIEPVTLSLPRIRATDCATEANIGNMGVIGDFHPSREPVIPKNLVVTVITTGGYIQALPSVCSTN